MKIYSQLTLVDPRYFDGNPYEVAGRAVAQAAGIALVLQKALDDARLFARNAELERHEDPDPKVFEEGPHGRLHTQLEDMAADIAAKLGILQKAAEFDPEKR